MPYIRFGDTIEAIPESPTSWIAEGRRGEVVGTPSGSGNWLVRWEGDTVFFGFHPQYVRIVGKD